MSKEKLNAGDDVVAAYKFVHSDDQKGQAFCVIGYKDDNTLGVIHQAENGTLEDIYSHFPQDECRFALTKRTFKVEMANSVKFIYIDWTPQGVKPTRRAILSTHKKQASDLAKPHHIDYQISEHKDLTEPEIQHKLGQVSGVNTSQLNVAVTNKVEYGSKGATARNAENIKKQVEIKSTLSYVDEKAFKEGLIQLRNGTDGTDWFLGRYSKKDTLEFVGVGTGGADELAKKLNKGFFEFGLVRVVDVVDKSSTVKYVYVEWIGEDVPSMTKGYIASKKSEIQHIFEPFTLKLDVSDTAELTQAGVENKIKTLSGTKSSVVAKKEEKKE